ncbi:SDA1 domain protein [Aspergillus nomiae NRRL 13137]|uniref:Protein SDA1 n=1 Tax=Aspergillus nomiae NRRL (strain ATCC 15546 / NRRL 13137 / CBS 260.88 / M93) TaxID=1509407 RepID=A0A0L1JA19_ASPN3|nr:SDA1 domain protein [Aspergillus nomiae NRRL 13137]KNG88589.1 SDA1 domain protein [Aspergillus nomiae NRRL 13137]
MVKRKLGALEKVEADLPNLQHKIRRDPKSYIEDFRAQHYQYESHREIFMAAPASATDTGIISLRELIDFVAHVADCYPDITKDFPQQLMDILTQHHLVLEPELREKIVGSLVLLKKKELLDSATLLQTLFPILITTPSKTLRALIFQKILMDLRTSNAKTTNHKLNRTMQTVLYNLVTSDRVSSKGLWAIKLIRELWKRQIWSDAKTVEVMKEASLSENEKVIIGGVRFFLGGDQEREEMEDESSDEEAIDLGKVKHQVGINKKTRKKSRAVEKAKATVKRKERKKNQPHPLNFSALHLLHDPQGFAETLFSKHLQNSKSKLNLEQKLQVLQLVTRLVGLHKLHIMQLYSYFQKYLTPRQPSVTSFLASLAQASHDLVPPDVLEPLIQKIANEFVSEASSSLVATAGLNAIREICARQPLAMNETLLQDLVMYRKSKDKGVVMAARGLLGLYRDLNPEMLKRRDRGKEASIGLRSGEKQEKRFGQEETGGIEGLELLEQWKEEERKKKRAEKGLPSDAEDGEEEEDEAADWEAWNVEDDEDSDDSGGWIDVQSDAEIDLSDSDDEKDARPSKKAKQDANNEENVNSETAQDKTEAQKPNIANIATTRILTPADLAKLQELRTQAAVDALIPGAKGRRGQTNASRHKDDPLTAEEIEGLAALSAGKATREERIAHAKEGKTDRAEHKSITAKRKERKVEQGKSTTNKEKARRKNIFMTLGKARNKGKRSLVETRNVLKAHQDRQKRGGRRGNIG